MRRPQVTSIITFLLLLVSIALYQNCSEPISDIEGNSGPECTENCGANVPGVLGVVLSDVPNGASITELDMNKAFYMKLTGFASAQDIYSCAGFYQGFDVWCPSADYRQIFQDEDFTFVNNIGRQSREPCTLSNCTFFSHTTFYGSTFQIEYTNANFTKRIKKNLYVRPPHLSEGFNEVAIWYTNDSAGRDRIIHWLGGSSLDDKLTTYVAPNQPFYSHWYKPTGVAGLQGCVKTFTGNTPPAVTTCTEWTNIVSATTIVSSDGKHHYNNNAAGISAGRYVFFVRNSSTQQVYNHATTVVVVE